MSKMDELRALREARYERTLARAAQARPGTRKAAEAPVAPPRAASGRAPGPASEPDAAEAGTEVALCGHRSMNGRTCTREQGHAAKNHRYS